MFLKHLDKNNLHHAYLIEGMRDMIISELFEFFKNLNVKTSGNPDFCHITIDNFKMDEALNLRAMSAGKSFSSGKKIFLVCVNNFSLDAQNVLLKMFEEPIENTHFFLVVPDVNALLKTVVSRFYLIKQENQNTEEEQVKNFLNMSLQNRLDFIKEFLPKKEEDNEDSPQLESNRSKALKFLNEIETVLHSNMSKRHFDISFFEHFFKVRKFLRMPGASPKTLMESVALVVPEKMF